MIKDEINRVARLYDKRASSVNAIKSAGQWIDQEFAEKAIEEIHKKIGLKSFGDVLEIGCGSGVLGKSFLHNSRLYVGFDLSTGMLQKFQSETQKTELNLIRASTNLIPLKDEIFDLVVLNGVTMYFPNEDFLDIVLNEIIRVSTKKCVIFIGENIIPSKLYWEFVWFNNLPYFVKIFAKPYIKFRYFTAKKIPRLAGKWKYVHKTISPEFIKKFFNNKGKIIISDSATYTIRKRLGNKIKGNKRVDFLIELK